MYFGWLTTAFFFFTASSYMYRVECESSLTFLLLSSHIYRCLIHSKSVIEIYFVPQRWSSKNKAIVYMWKGIWETQLDNMTSGTCVVLYRIHKYIATVVQQFKASKILIALLYHDIWISFTIHLGKSLFRVQKTRGILFTAKFSHL